MKCDSQAGSRSTAILNQAAVLSLNKTALDDSRKRGDFGRIAVCADRTDQAFVNHALRIGIDGITQSIIETEDALETLLSSLWTSGRYFSPTVLSTIQDLHASDSWTKFLTDKEIALLPWFSRAVSKEAIGRNFGIAESTVRAHRDAIRSKLGLTAPELIVWCHDMGFAQGFLKPDYCQEH